MTETEFLKVIERTRIRSANLIDALRDVLVMSVGVRESAKKHDVDAASVSRARKKLSKPVCPCCGQTIDK